MSDEVKTSSIDSTYVAFTAERQKVGSDNMLKAEAGQLGAKEIKPMAELINDIIVESMAHGKYPDMPIPDSKPLWDAFKTQAHVIEMLSEALEHYKYIDDGSIKMLAGFKAKPDMEDKNSPAGQALAEKRRLLGE